ncbi:DUF2721 domain-containing protein [Sporocytophaga myxococcoides]|uniref:DUF2721 domain-containing protein n=1 Tax=Sporocytophaga myxococcoides TaxID=153721 RepID=UPI000402B4EF|nr:DUF2721 domain-containing protein [Sporocytophaga myxococcoides]
MNDLTLTTPALLFPTISLLLLAYTNRYIAISNRIRALHSQYTSEQSDVIIKQIKILRQRITLIRNMQLIGIGAMVSAAFTMYLIYNGFTHLVHTVFGISLIMMLISLMLCAVEVYLSNKALLILLKDIEHLVD